jgi:hypothetical protein
VTRRIAPLVMLAGLTFAPACNGPGPTDPRPDPVFGRHATHLPFKAEFSGVATVIGPCAEGVGLLLLTTGAGHGTHVGASSMRMEVCTDVATMLPLAPVLAILVAASGDTLQTVLIGGGPDPVTGETESQWAVTGGSGRFAGAQGQFTNRGVHNPDLTWYARSDGWISLRM